MRRSRGATSFGLSFGLSVGVVLTALVGSVPSAGASGGSAAIGATTPACTSGNQVDVNGDGYRDLVGGDPGASVGAVAGAGDIVVRYGTSSGAANGSQTVLTQADAGLTPAAGDAFGSAIRVGFVDDDQCADVVVATPGDTVGGVAHAGSVQVFFGSTAGLGQGRPALTLDAGTTGLGTGPVAGERFATALALADDQAAGEPIHLAIGVPARDDGAAVDAGAVGLVDFAADGSVAAARTITQSSAGVIGLSETGDRFGSALDFGWLGDACSGGWCQELVVGVPGENDAAGAIVVLDTAGTPNTYVSTAISQNTPGAAGTAEPGDGFGSSLDLAVWGITGGRYLAVGVPREDVGSIKDAGAVQLFRFGGSLSTGDNELITQDSPSVAGAAEAYDRFGTTVLVSDCWTQSFQMCVVIGTPSEDLGSVPDAGMVSIINANRPPGEGDAALTQNSTGVPGLAQASEHFGQSLATTGAFDDLVIGVPDDIGYSRGVVVSVPWQTAIGASTTSGTAWEPATGTRFGAAIAPTT